MKVLILLILLPVLILAALRYEMTPWRLLSPAEYAAMEARIKSLEEQVEQAKQAATQRPPVSDGSWMLKDRKPSALDRTTPPPRHP